MSLLRLGTLLMLFGTACNSPTYLKVGLDTVTPLSVCGEKTDAGWGYGTFTSAGARFATNTRGRAQSEWLPRACAIDAPDDDCSQFILCVVDAGLYTCEGCSRSQLSFEASSDGGERVDGFAWCPSGVVRFRADVTGPCPPSYIY